MLYILVYILCPSLWKQLVLCNASTGFHVKWCLWNNCRSSILMIIHSANDSHSAFCKIPLLWSYITLLFLFDIDLPLLKPRLNKESSFLRERNLKKRKNLWRNKKLMWLLFVCERKTWAQLCLREEEGQEKSKKQYSPPLFQLLQFIPERF